jgi:5-keto 4-deoxyuronate isomerase
MKECMGHNSDPLDVMYSSATAKEKSGDEENDATRKRYIAQHRINVSDLPVGMRHLHLDRQTNSMPGRKQGKTKERKTGGPTSIKTMTSGPVIGKKRKD